MELSDFLVVNTATASQFRPQTEKLFDGEITFAHLPPGYWGPLYRVDIKDFVIWENQKPLRVNPDHVLYVRTDAMLDFINTNTNAVKDKDGLTSFLETHREEIELDSGVKFVEEICNYFHLPFIEPVRQLYEGISPGRWVMFQKPDDYEQANEWRNIPFKRGQELHLFQFYLNVPSNSFIKPAIFYGMTSGGNALQGRFNNHAITCIADVQEIRSSGWPYYPIQS